MHPRYRVPHHAEIALAIAVSGLVLVADLRGVIGCLVLVATLPWTAVVAGTVMVLIGLAGRWVVLRRRAA